MMLWFNMCTTCPQWSEINYEVPLFLFYAPAFLREISYKHIGYPHKKCELFIAFTHFVADWKKIDKKLH